MCNPLALIPVIAATTMFSATTQKQAAKSEAQLINHNAEVQNEVAEYNAVATENATSFNAETIENNALIYEELAVDTVRTGAHAAAQEKKIARSANARGRASIASSGTAVDTGTGLKLLVQNAGMGEVNAMTVINNAEREAYGFKTQASNEKTRAEGIRYTGELEAGNIRAGGQAGLLTGQFAADNARFAGKLNATSTLVSGIGSAARVPLLFN